MKNDNDIPNLEETEVAEEVIEEGINENEALQQKVDEAENKYKRALADYQNLQKRSLEDRQEWVMTANKDLLLRILTVFDTLVLASGHSEDQNLQISISHFLDVLKSEGVTRIKTEGQDFDPLVMEAIATADGKEGKVVHETRAGFFIHDKLLRAAQVTVGKDNKE